MLDLQKCQKGRVRFEIVCHIVTETRGRTKLGYHKKAQSVLKQKTHSKRMFYNGHRVFVGSGPERQ